MEQRRFSGKGHWYHETQTNHRSDEVLPLVPEAANVDDRFLLDLALPEEITDACENWLHPARTLCGLLFPLRVQVSRLHTLSAYDRLSTALTVAQACGVQRLCDHYAALLTPLPGPDSSRESNRRLAQLTQYARQLTCSPNIIDAKAQQQLDEVGLTMYDIVLLNQIIGFIGFQARVVALFQAMLGQPVRWLPGHHTQPHTEPNVSPGAWQSFLPEVELRFASARQMESLVRWQSTAPLQNVSAVLSHEPRVLDCMGEIMTNGFNDAGLSPLNNDSVKSAIELLNQSPDRFSAAQFTPLLSAGIAVEQAVTLLAWRAFCGWLDRLHIALRAGE
jgi:uncharacterized protein YciW